MSFAVYKIAKSGPPIHVTPKPAPKDESAAVAHARAILKRSDCVAMVVTHDGLPTVGLHSSHGEVPKALLAWKPERVELA